MIVGAVGSVTSSTVIQVVLPKRLISLVPLSVIGCPRTAGSPGFFPGAVGVTLTVLPRISGARLMAK